MNITRKIIQPFRYIKKGTENLFFGAARSTQIGIKKGLKVTGKAAGSIIWDNKLDKLYAEIQNNKYIKISIEFLWGILFSWIGYKIYTILFMESNAELSLFAASYLLLAIGVLFYFWRDISRLTAWHKRENIKKQINICEPEMLKKFLLRQNLTTKQKVLLNEKLKQSFENKEILDIYEKNVLCEMDKKTEEIIERYSTAVSIGSTITPRLSWDYIISILAFSKMLLEIAKAYKVRLSLRTFISIFIFGLAIISASAIITQGVKRITEKNQSVIALLGGIGAWLASKIIELAIPYYTIGTVGYAIQYILRPIKPCD